MSSLLARRTASTVPSRTVRAIGAHGADEVNAAELERGICDSAARPRPTPHALHGQCYVNTVLVLHTAKGGVATSWMLREMKSRGMSPAALLLNVGNPIMAQGAAFAELAFMDRFEVDITEAIRSGDHVTVDPWAGLVIVE